MRDRGRRGSLTKHDAVERLNVATDRNATSRVMRRPHRHGPGAHGPLAPERPLVAFILDTRRVAGDLGRPGRAYDKDMRGRTQQAALALLDNNPSPDARHGLHDATQRSHDGSSFIPTAFVDLPGRSLGLGRAA